MERKGGSYLASGEGKPVLKERTKENPLGSRPCNADGSPMYERPHEAQTDAAKAESVADKKGATPAKTKGGE